MQSVSVFLDINFSMKKCVSVPPDLYILLDLL